jgi:hypothetical protein
MSEAIPASLLAPLADLAKCALEFARRACELLVDFDKAVERRSKRHRP